MPEIYSAYKDARKEALSSYTTNYTTNRRMGAKHSPLAWFLYNPRKVNFETQEDEERVILLLRRHPITNLPWILTAVFLALLPALLFFFPILDYVSVNFQIAILLLWYLVVIALVLEGALSWFFNVYIVTDERLIDVDFYSLIYRRITDAKIDKIQDVTYKVGGVLGTVFNYGDVLIQTAGAIPNLEFEAVAKPAEVARILQELRTEEEIEALEGRVR